MMRPSAARTLKRGVVRSPGVRTPSILLGAFLLSLVWVVGGVLLLIISNHHHNNTQVGDPPPQQLKHPIHEAMVQTRQSAKDKDSKQDHPSSAVASAHDSSKPSRVDCIIVSPDDDTGDTTKSSTSGTLQITLRHDLAPVASQTFLDHVQVGYFDGVFIFRVLKGFVAQFGIRHKELGSGLLPKPPRHVKDDDNDNALSNVRGTLSFAGGNPWTQQVFVNLGNNQRLDREHSRPFATVNAAGMAFLDDHLHRGYKDGQGQVQALRKGQAAVRAQFPYMSWVETCRVVS